MNLAHIHLVMFTPKTFVILPVIMMDENYGKLWKLHTLSLLLNIYNNDLHDLNMFP